MADNFLGNIFNSDPPKSVFDIYTDDTKSLAQARNAKLISALNQIKLKYAPQMAQQAADTGAADVTIEQNKAKYAPQLSQAELGLRNSQIIQEHAQTIATNLLARGRQLDNITKAAVAQGAPESVQNNLLLQKAKIQAQLAHVTSVATTAAAEKRRQGALYQFNQTLKGVPAAERPSYIAQHAPQLEQILNTNLDQANQQNPGMQAPQSPMQTPSSPAPFNPMGNMTGSSPQQQTPNAPAPMIAAPQNQAPPAPANEPSLPQKPSALELQSQFMSNAKAAGAKATQRLNSAIELEKIMSDPAFDKLAQSASKYAGIAGKVKGGIDAWFNTNPKEYNDYLQFKNQYASMITNIMRQVEGLGVQESTREELRGNLLQSMEQLSSNPERALEQYSRVKSQLRKLASAASLAAQPTFPGAREKAAGISFDDVQPSNTYQEGNTGTVRLTDKDGNEFDVPESRADEAIKDYKLKRKG